MDNVEKGPVISICIAGGLVLAVLTALVVYIFRELYSVKLMDDNECLIDDDVENGTQPGIRSKGFSKKQTKIKRGKVCTIEVKQAPAILRT